jgi:hypothetical protein
MTPQMFIVTRNRFGVRPFNPSQLLDADTAGWRDAIIANGGSIDSASLTAFDAFVRGCKTDGIWDLILDCAFFVGLPDLNSILVKLKTPTGVARVLTNSNFVGGDYTATGASAGLGNAENVNKYLNSNFSPSANLAQANCGLFAYVSGLEATGSARLIIGCRQHSDTFSLGWLAAGTLEQYRSGGAIAVTGAAGALEGFLGGTTRAGNVMQYYQNGMAQGVTAVSSGSLPPTVLYILASNTSGVASLFCRRKVRAHFFTRGVTAAQALSLSNRVNAVMTAFGANKY